MKKPLEQARLYLQKASEDEVLLNKIVDDLDVSDNIFGFHAQQAIEKLLKALLSTKGIRFKKTHNLRELMDLLAEARMPLPDPIAEIDYLTPYGALARYENLPFNAPFNRRVGRKLVSDVRSWVEKVGDLG